MVAMTLHERRLLEAFNMGQGEKRLPSDVKLWATWLLKNHATWAFVAGFALGAWLL